MPAASRRCRSDDPATSGSSGRVGTPPGPAESGRDRRHDRGGRRRQPAGRSGCRSASERALGGRRRGGRTHRRSRLTRTVPGRSLWSLARVAELVDAGGLNPPSTPVECGFDSHPGHIQLVFRAGWLCPVRLVSVIPAQNSAGWSCGTGLGAQARRRLGQPRRPRTGRGDGSPAPGVEAGLPDHERSPRRRCRS